MAKREILIVYRWEHLDGRGPYHKDFKVWTSEGGVFEMARHYEIPEPRLDVSKYYSNRRGASCGFISLDQERAWFLDSERTYMRERLGLTLATYAVPSTCVRIGSKQRQFLKWKAVRIA